MRFELNSELEKKILELSGAKSINSVRKIQNLWNNYGYLLRIELGGSDLKSVILKYIKIPDEDIHPKGMTGDFSKKRKIKSYEVETTWYEKYNAKHHNDIDSRTPECLSTFSNHKGEYFLLMEDLSNSGYTKVLTPENVSLKVVKVLINWLASFHAKHLNVEAIDLWHVGTYWHLETRPDELMKMGNSKLKLYAPLIDERLKNTRFRTLVHGDAKLANFCFNDDLSKAGGVDFQYVGSGCGVKDLAYLIGSCFGEKECEVYEKELLDYYFDRLSYFCSIDKSEFLILSSEWRELYPVACADFQRFLMGWSPGHWKINSYLDKQTNTGLSLITRELIEVAKSSCKEAANIQMEYFPKEIETTLKPEGSSEANSILTEVDLRCQDKIIDVLRTSVCKYNLGLLSEELEDDHSRFEKYYFWAIDPLDGTWFYANGENGFAVSVALVSSAGEVLVSCVALPMLNRMHWSIKDEGTKSSKIFDNINLTNEITSNFGEGDRNSIKGFLDKSIKNDPKFDDLNELFDVNFLGGAVYNAMMVLEHKNAFYIKKPKPQKGGGAIWDYAAVSLILEQAEIPMADFEGNRLSLNKKDGVYYNRQGLKIFSNEFTRKEVEHVLK